MRTNRRRFRLRLGYSRGASLVQIGISAGRSSLVGLDGAWARGQSSRYCL